MRRIKIGLLAVFMVFVLCLCGKTNQNMDGGTFDAATISLPSKWGDQYELELRFEDECYSVWQSPEPD